MNQALSPTYLSTLKGLSLKARLVLEGTLTGRHLSPLHGFSSEFSQYKGYVPGDDLKHLDWKVLGRSGQLVTRQYRDETNASVYLVVDSSRSMAYGGGAGVPKLEYAVVLAASVAMMAFAQRDAVSLAHGAGEVAAFIPPRNSPAHLRQVLNALEGLAPAGVTDLKALFGKLAGRLKSGSMTFLFTDLWQDSTAIVSGLREIRFKNQAVTLARLLAPTERDFLDGTNVELEDMETRRTLKISPRHLKGQYLETLKAHDEILQAECHALGVKMVTLGTEAPYFQAMRRILEGP
ncbi:MAG TPA: DUF58 domain-containing protein [Fibrobacteria bacterium]|nr:DUF58 domain-containing protein [Fibrobacteria bacterium]